jgi:thiol-disulfide isomerase/thioredoxin
MKKTFTVVAGIIVTGVIIMTLIMQSGADTLSLDEQAPAFEPLPAVDGKAYNLDAFSDSRAVVVSFTCNHCPYAQAYEDRFIALAKEYGPKGVAFLAINPNDAEGYPADSFEAMKVRAEEKAFPFPYLRDESQTVAKAYGAVCTPHIFLFDEERKLVYEGRIDDNWKKPEDVTAQDLRDAIEDVLGGRPVRTPQTNPMGCSIKWK